MTAPTASSSLHAAPSGEEDDRSLAARVAVGDRAAFERLMRRYNRRLYRLARSALRDDAEAEDALQEAYLSAYRGIAGYRGDASLATWLSRLVLNECLGRKRRHARRENVIPMVSLEAESEAGIPIESEASQVTSNETNAPEQSAARAEMRALLERKLDQLPEIFRVVFVMRTVEEMSVEETAQCLGLTEVAVRSRHFRARSLLRESLAQEIDLAERGLFDFGGAHCNRIVERVLARLDAQGER